MSSDQLTHWEQHLAHSIRAACRWEVGAKKPGNVHPDASFSDLSYNDFIESADIVAPILAQAERLGVGRVILNAVTEVQKRVGKNTNLGIILLLAPLAAVPREQSTKAGICEVLNELTVLDANLTYDAISLAKPGGMGVVGSGDLSSGPTGTLKQMMELAFERDRIAEEYCREFRIVHKAAGCFLRSWGVTWDFDQAVIELHLCLMANYPDTLIARKCGWKVAQEAASRARDIVGGPDWPRGPDCELQLQEFDHWLREDGHRRNPGTSADLVAAALFVNLRERRIVVDGDGDAHLPHPDDTL